MIAWFVLLIGLSASIYFFIADRDDAALSIIFLTIYCTLSIFYFFKVLYYAEYNATLNEFYFLLLANIIPLAIFLMSPFFPLSQITFLDYYIETPVSFYNSSFSITAISMFTLPYLLFSAALQVRCFTKYEFIRLTSQSTKGPSSEWTAIAIYFIFGFLFLLTGVVSGDLIGLLFGLFFLFSGVTTFLGK